MAELSRDAESLLILLHLHLGDDCKDVPEGIDRVLEDWRPRGSERLEEAMLEVMRCDYSLNEQSNIVEGLLDLPERNWVSIWASLRIRCP